MSLFNCICSIEFQTFSFHLFSCFWDSLIQLHSPFHQFLHRYCLSLIMGCSLTNGLSSQNSMHYSMPNSSKKKISLSTSGYRIIHQRFEAYHLEALHLLREAFQSLFICPLYGSLKFFFCFQFTYVQENWKVFLPFWMIYLCILLRLPFLWRRLLSLNCHYID